MTKIHQAIAEHAMEESERLRGLLKCTLQYDLGGTLKGMIVDALSQQAEPTDTFTAVDMATAAAQGFRDGQEAVEQATAQGEQQPVAHRLINAEGEVMTDWHDGAPPDNFIDICGVAMAGTRVELAFAAPIAQAAPQPEQSGLVEAASGALAAIQDALEDAYNNAYPECCGQAHLECCGSPVQAWSEADQKIMDRFAPHERALRAALSAQGAGDADS